MRDALLVTDVRLAEASAADVRRGLVGFVSCVLNESVRLDGLTLRRTRKGHPTISFPARRDSAGREHPIVRLLRLEDRRLVEREILRALGIAAEAAS